MPTSFQPSTTPLRYLPRFSDAVGAPIYIKQDDCGPISWAGTKARKVIRILQDAKQRDVQVLVMAGPSQSNSCRILAAASAAIGIQVVLVLHGSRPSVTTPGLKILADVQAEIRWGGKISWSELEAKASAIVDDFCAAGISAEAVPQGCTSALGVSAMIDAAIELQTQLDAIDVKASKIVHASASGGMHAGFHAAHVLHGTPVPHSVMIVKDIYSDVESHYAKLVQNALRESDQQNERNCSDSARLDWDQMGEGYEQPTTQALEAGQLLAKLEGLLVEPSYTGKALAAVIDNAKRQPGLAQVFWHSGGLPAYFGQ